MTEAQFTEAAQLFSERKYYDAVRKYTAIAALESASAAEKARAFGNVSACYASLKDYEKALASAQEAVGLDPSNVKALGRVATALEGMKRYEEALPIVTRASQLDPSNAVYTASIQRVRGLISGGHGVVTADSRDAYYYSKSLDKGKEAMRTENYLEAIRHFGKALDLFPTATGTTREKAVLLSNRSVSYFKAGKPEESADAALSATEVDPAYARGFFRLGCAKHKLAKLSEAYDALESCLSLDAAHADARKLLDEIAPAVLESRKTAAQKAEDAAKRVQELREQQLEERAKAMAGGSTSAVTRAYASSYMYCNYCNETGHMRDECPLRRRKRARTD